MFYMQRFLTNNYNHIIGFRKKNIYYTKKEHYLKILLNDDIKKWLMENDIDYQYNDNTPLIYFKEKRDAMLFKLKFG
jgi:hypothetical protein